MNERAGFHAILTALLFRREVHNDEDRALAVASTLATKILAASTKLHPYPYEEEG